ncbi:hypothetical protein EU546_05580 [Candidatus Thorarchaeota archaeon]|nr:MAG: hypothetical protein EU546_05580 [Candidatus Thorarchaeota archaeon]
MTELDPDWPGNWEGEHEPETDAIPDSIESQELLRLLESDPDRESFKQYPPMTGFHIFTAMLAIIIGIFVVFLFPLLSIMLYAVGILFGGIVVREGKKNETLLTPRGVGTKGLWTWPDAIEWQHVEHVETHSDGEKVKEVVFRGNNRIVWHDNSSLARSLDLDIVSHYVSDVYQWTKRKKLGWSADVVVYSRPGSEMQLNDVEAGRRMVDEFDPDVGHYATKDILGSLSSEELLNVIRDDQDCEKLRRLGNAGTVFILAAIFTAIPLIALHPLVYEYGFAAAMPAFAVIGIVWLIILGWIAREVGKYGYYLSRTGIGAVETFTDIAAIRWSHIEWVDVWLKDDQLRVIEFAGNQRLVRIENHMWHRKLTITDVEKYLPHIMTWEKDRSEDWRQGILRYRRVSKSIH